MDKKDLIVESNVYAAMFKCTCEQGTTLYGNFRHQQKKDFDMFMKLGWKVLNGMEKNKLTNNDYLDQISGLYHELNKDIKEQLEKSLTEVKI